MAKNNNNSSDVSKSQDLQQQQPQTIDIEALNTTIEKLTNENAELNGENDKLTETNAQLMQANATLKNQNTDLVKQVSELNQQIAALRNGSPVVNIRGFVLNVGDPFGDGTIRSYRSAGGKTNQPDRLPFVLPEKDDASKKALNMYIVRATAAGDSVRVEAAEKALKK
jgi:cell division protein FtsB